MSKNEGLFKKRIAQASREDWQLIATVPTHITQEMIEDAKREIFSTMPKYIEMHTYCNDVCGNKEWVRIPLEEWKKLMELYISLKKWFGT